MSKAGGNSTTCTSTESVGKYSLEVEVGEYTVRFTGRVCEGESCSHGYVEQQDEHVQVTAGNFTTVNAPLLEVDGKISGKTTSGGAPLVGVSVCVSGPEFECSSTNPSGEYTVERLPPGSYQVSFGPSEVCKAICQPASNYILQYWNNQPTVEAAGTVVVKESESVAGINAELQPGGHISGRVTNASIYAPAIANLVVCANPTTVNKEGVRVGEAICALTNSSGEYTISALGSGGYEVEFRGEVCVEEASGSKCTHPYIAQFAQSIVSVSAPGTTSGINGSLLEGMPAKPANTGAPAVTVAETVKASLEKTLSCSAGSWSNNPTSLSYRWLRNGGAIAGQTANTYTTQGADAGMGIACEVTASNAAGSTSSTSNTVQIPKPAPGVALFKGVNIKGSVVSVTLLCSGASSCSGALKLLTTVSAGRGKHVKRHSVTIATGSFSMPTGKSVTLRMHMTAQGRKLLSKAGRKGLKVQAAGSDVQAHTTTLRPPSKHR